MITATIVGSLPKPLWLQEKVALNAEGKDVHGRGADWLVPADLLQTAQDDAVRLALCAQARAGLDIVTDGEQRRTGYLRAIVERLGGFDYRSLATKWTQNHRRQAEVGRCVGPVVRGRPLQLDEARFALDHSDLPLKVTLPGPLTVVEATADEFYHDEAGLAFAIAAALRAEAEALFALGVEVVQFDEPVFARRLDAVRSWGLDALTACVRGLRGTTAVHICYSYPMPGVPRPIDDSYPALLELLAGCPVDQLSLEFKEAGLDLALLSLVGSDQDVLLGCVSNASDRIETPEEIARMLDEAGHHFRGRSLIASTDCGLVPLMPSVAEAKMRSLALGRDLVNGHSSRACENVLAEMRQ